MNRRAFLLGAGASVSLAAAHQISMATGMTTTPTPWNSRVRYRAIRDITFSSMNDTITQSDAAVHFVFRRGEHTLMNIMINSRATFRWAATPGNEFVIRDDNTFRIEVGNCQESVTATIISNIERDSTLAAKYLHETFHWRWGNLVTSDAQMADPAFDYLLRNTIQPVEDTRDYLKVLTEISNELEK